MTTIRKSARVVQAFGASVLLAATLFLVACGSGSSGGGGGGGGGGGSQITVRPLAADFATRKAVAYSGYRGSTRDTAPSYDDTLEDMQLLAGKGFGLLRMFGAGSDTQLVLEVLHDHPELDIKMQLGIWISGPDSTSHDVNYAAMDEGISVATDPDNVDKILAVSVGNETMIDWSFLAVPPSDMLTYINYVRARVTQPVTTDDNWAFFRGLSTSGGTLNALPIVQNIDFVSMHTYACLDTKYGLWDWQQVGTPEGPARATAMMNAAMVWTKSNFSAVKNYLHDHNIDIPITIGETGWKSFPSDGELQRAHPVNQAMYIADLNAWNALPKTGNTPLNIFYFEAFDETWKGGDDRWGLWDVARKEKYVLWSAESDGFDSSTELALPASPDDDAEYYIAPVPNGTITADKYILFSETIGVDDAQPVGATAWNPWDGNTAVGADSSDVSEGSHSVEITPTPKVWGWGMAFTVLNPDDLSQFSTGANLNFSIKTTYAGKLEIGFYTGTTTNFSGVDVYMPIQSGQYGYVNDGAWHNVSIPISTIKTYATPAFGMPISATLNMAYVSSPFVIADRYAITGNGSSTVHILVDNIYWSKP